jgi:hypothetical protein
MNIDLTKIPTSQLKAIRQILVAGAEATAERKYADADGSKALKKLTAENEKLRKVNQRRNAIEQAGLEWDEPYFMSFSDAHFIITLNKLSEAMREAEKEVAIASRTRSMKIPNLIGMPELDAVSTVREHFKEMRDRRRNGGSGED